MKQILYNFLYTIIHRLNNEKNYINKKSKEISF